MKIGDITFEENDTRYINLVRERVQKATAIQEDKYARLLAHLSKDYDIRPHDESFLFDYVFNNTEPT